MNRIINSSVCNLILFLLLFYNYLYAANPEGGSLLLQGSIVLVLVISIVYFIIALIYKGGNRFFFRAWTAFLLLNTVGFLFTAEYSNRYDYGMFLGVLVTFFTFYPFYYFSQRGILTSKKLVWFFIVLVPITIFGFYSNQAHILSSRSTGNMNVVNNMSYYFVRLMPFVFLIRKRRLLSIIVMSILMIFVIIGSKRGALIAGGMTLLMYFYYLWKTQDKQKRLQGYAMVISAIAVLSALAYRFFINNQFLIERMLDISEGGGSGRDEVYSSILQKWFTSPNPLNFLFGYGFAASRDLTGGLYAHNDWLEIISNFGLLGWILYLILVFAGIKFSFNKNLNLDKKILFKTIILIWLFTSMVSMWYTNIQGYTNTILLAYLIGSQSNSLE